MLEKDVRVWVILVNKNYISAVGTQGPALDSIYGQLIYLINLLLSLLSYLNLQ